VGRKKKRRRKPIYNRSKEVSRKAISTYLDHELIETIELHCKSLRISKTEFFNEAVRNYFSSGVMIKPF
jgi:hypothetical protein